jgi:hypothetical protein
MLRRDFLKLVGVASVAPQLIVTEQKLITKKHDGDFIPTGFPIIDEAMGGGVKKGDICSFYGVRPQTYSFAHSLAARLGRTASVGLMVNGSTRPKSDKYWAVNSDVIVHDTSQRRYDWKDLTQWHDAIVCATIQGGCDSAFEDRCRSLLAANSCALVTHVPMTSYGRNVWPTSEAGLSDHIITYTSSHLLCLEPQPHIMAQAAKASQRSGHDSARAPADWSGLGEVYSLALSKNRYGRPHVVEPIIHDWKGFVPMKESYWDYDQKTGLISGPYLTPVVRVEPLWQETGFMWSIEPEPIP